MRKMNLKAILMCAGLFFAVNSQAQLGNLLKGALGGNSSQTEQTSTTAGGITSILKNLIGTADVNSSSLNGTWVYESPAVVFESSNLLKKAGGSLMTGTIEKKMQTYLTKIGFAPGKVQITFDGNSKYTMKIGTRESNGTYTVEGSNITLTREGLLSHPVTANVAVVGKELQMTFKADKLLEFFTKLSSFSSSTTLSTISSLAGNYDGMQVGFQFKKQ